MSTLAAPGDDADTNGASRVSTRWGSDLRCGGDDRSWGRLLHIGRGQAFSLECHASSEETVFVLRGSLDVLLEGERGQLCARRLGPGMTVRLLPGRRHRYVGLTHVDLLEVISPDRDGTVRLDDHADHDDGSDVVGGAR